MSLALRRSATRYTHQRRCLAQIATKGSCMPNLRGIPGKPWRPIASTSNNYYLAHAQRMRRSVTDIYIYIYIYTHRESLVRNHEPCAKALGNYRYTHQRRCCNYAVYQENHGDPLHVQVIIIIIILRMRRSVTDIYIYIYIYPSREPSAQS